MKFPLPALDAADAAGLLRWAAAALVIGSGACWIDGRIRRLLDLDGRPASDLRPGTPSRASDPTLAP